MVLLKDLSTNTEVAGHLRNEYGLAAKLLEVELVKKPHHNSLIHRYIQIFCFLKHII